MGSPRKIVAGVENRILPIVVLVRMALTNCQESSMSTYAALIYNPHGLDGHADPEIVAEYHEFIGRASAAGVLRGGHPLYGTETATTVTVAGGKAGGDVTTTDGPFAETKEILAGFFLLECEDLDAALEWAAQIPGAWHGKIEVRPVVAD